MGRSMQGGHNKECAHSGKWKIYRGVGPQRGERAQGGKAWWAPCSSAAPRSAQNGGHKVDSVQLGSSEGRASKACMKVARAGTLLRGNLRQSSHVVCAQRTALLVCGPRAAAFRLSRSMFLRGGCTCAGPRHHALLGGARAQRAEVLPSGLQHRQAGKRNYYYTTLLALAFMYACARIDRHGCASQFWSAGGHSRRQARRQLCLHCLCLPFAHACLRAGRMLHSAQPASTLSCLLSCWLEPGTTANPRISTCTLHHSQPQNQHRLKQS